MLILDDPVSAAVPLPHMYGVDDFPIVVQDKAFASDGSLSERPRPTFGLLGDHILINGTYDPYLEVGTTLVRLRILNASNARMYHVGFVDGRPLQVIGTDSGLLPAPVPTDRVSLSPAERVEVVVGFAPGEVAVLHSFAGGDDIDEGEFDLLQVRAAAQLKSSPALPREIPVAPPITAPAGARVRRFTLNGHDAINHREMDLARIDEVVPAGAVEVWEVENTVYAHNFHIHEAAFRILTVDRAAPPAYAGGRKDTVYVPPRTTVRLAVQFGHHTDPATPYMYHCHLLRHEDEGMMGQFVIVTPGTESNPPGTVTTHH
jgi:FtsP/CotA-like multicopper oxidase with cupredoxin domain